MSAQDMVEIVTSNLQMLLDEIRCFSFNPHLNLPLLASSTKSGSCFT